MDVSVQRGEHLGRLSQRFDVLVVGGGASGLGAALDAAVRGLKVALVEASDFARGTSSRSTKLVHGGVRYLAQGNFGLVREALRERGRLRRNAPHVVADLEFVVPAYALWTGPYYGFGLKMYDVLAGKYRLGRSELISKEEVLERIPNLAQEGLRGGIVYHDGQFDDARLAVTLARSAIDHGATLVNHAPVVRLLHEEGRCTGAVVRDAETGREHTVSARVVVNATGIWSDELRRMDDPQAPQMLARSQGVHLVLPAEFLPGRAALMIPKTDDGRVLFVIPWHGRALVGTTDTPVERTEAEPRALEEEIQFLLEHAARYLAKDPSRSDVLSTFTGVRPLVRRTNGAGQTKALSRDHVIVVSKSGLVTIVGGKWTTYRKMGEDTIDTAITVGKLEAPDSSTAELRLHGAPEKSEVSSSGVTAERFAIYGTDAEQLRRLMEARPELAKPLHPRLPYVGAEIVWAARAELARTVEDVLSRRTRALILDARAAQEVAPQVAKWMAQELGHDERWEADQVQRFHALAAGYVLGGEAQKTSTEQVT